MKYFLYIKLETNLCVYVFEEINGELVLLLFRPTHTFEEQFITFNLDFGIGAIF